MYHKTSDLDPLDELNDCKSGQTSRISKASSFPRHASPNKHADSPSSS